MSYENHPNLYRAKTPPQAKGIMPIQEITTHIAEILDDHLVREWLSTHDNQYLYLMTDGLHLARVTRLCNGRDNYDEYVYRTVFGLNCYTTTTMTPGGDDPRLVVSNSGLLPIDFEVYSPQTVKGNAGDDKKSRAISKAEKQCHPPFPAWADDRMISVLSFDHQYPLLDPSQSSSKNRTPINDFFTDVALCSAIAIGEFKDRYDSIGAKSYGEVFFGKFNTTERTQSDGSFHVYDPHVEPMVVWYQPRRIWGSHYSWAGMEGAESLMSEAVSWAISSAILSECMSVVPVGFKGVLSNDTKEDQLEYQVAQMVVKSIRIDDDDDPFGTYDVIGYISPVLHYEASPSSMQINRRSNAVKMIQHPESNEMSHCIPFYIGRYDLSVMAEEGREEVSPLTNFTFDVMNALSELIDMGVGIDFECQFCNTSASSLEVNDFDRLFLASIAPSSMLHNRVCSTCKVANAHPGAEYADAVPDANADGAKKPSPKAKPQSRGSIQQTHTTQASSGTPSTGLFQVQPGAFTRQAGKTAFQAEQEAAEKEANPQPSTRRAKISIDVGDVTVNVRQAAADAANRFGSLGRNRDKR